MRRSSDNATQDIGFTANGDLDTASLKTFVGNNDGFLNTWYDQSGIARNLTQTDTSKQPIIVQAGIIYRRNSKPTVYFDATNDGMLFSGDNYLNVNGFSVNLVAGSNSNTSAARRAVQGFNNWLIGPYSNTHAWFAGGFNLQVAASWSTTDVERFTVIQSSHNANTSFRNGSNLVTGNTKTIRPGKLSLGASGAFAEPLNGYISEVVSYPAELNTTELQSMDASQAAYYNACSPSASTFTVAACGSYTWVAKGNKQYTASNTTDTIMLKNAAGCDSIVTLNLTITPAPNATTTATAYGSYTWLKNNTTYTSSGTYTSSYTNSLGCAVVDTLKLTINPYTGCFKQVSAGHRHTLAIKNDGTLWAWGHNYYGQVGNGTTKDTISPTLISSASNWSSVSTCYDHSMAIKTDGSLWAWGYNFSGELGIGNNTDSKVPVQVGTANNWASVSAAKNYTLAIKNDGTLWGWGGNSAGLLGNNTFTNTNVPVQIGTANNWATVSTGYNHNAALKTDGTLWAWGDNLFGQLGNNTTSSIYVPTKIGTATNWASVSVGNYLTTALKTDGTAWAWGLNTDGQVGDGTYIDKKVPTQVGTATNYTSVQAGSYYALGLKLDGTLWAWGSNQYGQFGNNSNSSSNTPIQISGANNWASINTKTNYSTAIKTDGSLYTWGPNSSGELGTGSSNLSWVPVLIACPVSSTTTVWNGTIWSNGIPTSTIDAIIASSTAPASFTSKSLTLNSGVSLTTTGITATVNGNIVNNGNGIAGTGGLTIAANSTISGNAISFNGALTVNTGATLTTGGLLTLASNATNTARVANSAGDISGNVTVQRYIPGKRAYRFLTAPLSSDGLAAVNVSTSWQTQTHIVGPSGTGLDAVKPMYSMLTYASGAWQNVSNTTNTALFNSNPTASNKAFALFVTGDRTIDLNSITQFNNSTLSATGKLLQGTQTFSLGSLAANAFAFVGNPYASPVDLNQVFLNAGTSNLNRTFYTWDPTLSTTGGYVTISWNAGTSSYDVTPGAGTSQTQILQSGQAFFVQATNAATTNLVFEENDKSTTNINNVFGIGNGQIDNLNINLQRIENGNLSTRDGVTASFGASYNKAVNFNEDAEKLFNNEEGITIRRNNKSLSIERRPFITNTNDTIFLGLNRLVPNTNYTLNLNAEGWDAGMQAVLVDKLLSTEIPINLQSSNQDINITSATENATDRFMIVFRGTGNLPNNKLSLVATKRDKDVQLTWNIANEQGVKEYELQRSVNGTAFTAINNQVASNKGEYTNLDTKANNGINYYRVKMTMLNDDTRYSNVITINLQHLTSNNITVFPNPIKRNIAQIQLNELEVGDYTIRLIDMNGKLLQTQIIKHQGGTASRTLSLGNLAVGTYQLQLEGKGINKTISLVKGN